MPTEVGVWLDEPLARSRPEVSYVRKSTKFVKCRNEYAHMSFSRRKRAATDVRESMQGLFAEWIAKKSAAIRQLADCVTPTTSVEAKFHKLANEWSSEVSNVSSVGALTAHPKYQEIIRLGWDVVPFLLADLQGNKGFWFTALSEITGIRPFDRTDAGNGRKMAEAWIKWGKRRGII